MRIKGNLKPSLLSSLLGKLCVDTDPECPLAARRDQLLSCF